MRKMDRGLFLAGDAATNLLEIFYQRSTLQHPCRKFYCEESIT